MLIFPLNAISLSTAKFKEILSLLLSIGIEFVLEIISFNVLTIWLLVGLPLGSEFQHPIREIKIVIN